MHGQSTPVHCSTGRWRPTLLLLLLPGLLLLLPRQRQQRQQQQQRAMAQSQCVVVALQALCSGCMTRLQVMVTCGTRQCCLPWRQQQ
jgi:hypothetical protein